MSSPKALVGDQTVQKNYYVYILGNENCTFYVGVTSNLVRRVYEHRIGAVQGFTQKYNLKKLLYFEVHQRAIDAITREKRLKRWNREWKLRLITKLNPGLNDLYESIME